MTLMKPRQLLHLVAMSGAIVFIWIVFGIFNSFEFHRRTIETGNTQPWFEPAMFQQTSSFVWAMFTPIIIFIAERFPIRKPHRMRNALVMLAFTPLLSVIRAGAGGFINDLGEGRTPRLSFVLHSIDVRFFRYAYFILIIIGVTNLLLAQRAAAARERNAIALRTAVSNAELQRLRASMQPRLMFATLDAIAAKVMTAPEIADRMLILLGDLLRALLEFGRRSSVTLAEELEIVDRFFEIEKTRTDGEFTTRVDVEEELLAAQVPPMLLHTLVESALLGNGDAPHRLELHGREERGILHIELRHDQPNRIPAVLAFEETRARLQQAFGADADIHWRSEPQGVVTKLSMPFRTEVAA
jgi:two-component system, LytTR family, sensor kinase